jgi:hypothetical protein
VVFAVLILGTIYFSDLDRCIARPNRKLCLLPMARLKLACHLFLPIMPVLEPGLGRDKILNRKGSNLREGSSGEGITSEG